VRSSLRFSTDEDYSAGTLSTCRACSSTPKCTLIRRCAYADVTLDPADALFLVLAAIHACSVGPAGDNAGLTDAEELCRPACIAHDIFS
jgi:hypothetical protein